MNSQIYSFSFEEAKIYTLMINYRNFSEPLPEHSHGKKTYELHYVTHGTGHVILEAQKHPLSPGSIYITGPNIRHEQIPDSDKSLTEFGCFFLMDTLHKNNPLLNIFMNHPAYIGKASDEISYLTKKILFEKKNTNLGTEKKIPLLLSELLIECIRIMASPNHMPLQNEIFSPEENFQMSFLSERNMQLLIDEAFLLEYPTITLERMADIIGLSHRQTQRFIEKCYDKSFSEKKLEARMAAAKTLLSNSQLSITEISDKIGYSSIEHFSNTFKKYHGVSPRAYRRK